jgi:type IV secretion system protein VirB1
MLFDLAQLVRSCAPNVGVTTILAIISAESGGKVFSIGDNTTRTSLEFKSQNEAIQNAKDLIQKGHSLDLGLAQINNKNLDSLGISLDQIFDPCTNIKAAASILGWGYARAVKKHGDGQHALHAAFSAYNTGSLERGFSNGYVNKILGKAHKKSQILLIPELKNSGPIEFQKQVDFGKKDSITPFSSPLSPPHFTEGISSSDEKEVERPENSAEKNVDPRKAQLSVKF